MMGQAASSGVVAAGTVGGRVRLGRVVANTGRDVLVMIDSHDTARASTRLGDIVVIGVDGQATVGVVSGMNEPAPGLDNDGFDMWMAQVELAGTLGLTPDLPTFSRSIVLPPALGDVVYKAAPTDLRRLFRNGDDKAYPIGMILGQKDVAATIDGDKLVDGGFAILGGSGSGKSCTMASLVRALLRHRHSVSTVLIDPYNEYGRSFGRAAVCIQPEPGLLPHWLLSFTELKWVLSRSGGALDLDECSILEEAVPTARIRYQQRTGRGRETGKDVLAVTVETPIPYRMTDLLSYFDKTEQTDDSRPARAYRRLRTRIMAAISDPRLAIIFGTAAPTDSLAALIKRIFRLEKSAAPMAILQLGHLTAGVDRLVVAIVCRLAMALAEWGGGRRGTLLLIDDAARYAPATPLDEAGQISLNALRDLGGRARKLGTSLGLVTTDTRAINLEVVGQCATYFVHRMTSQMELDVVQDLLPEAVNAYLGSVGNFGIGEAVGIGRGVPLAGRIAIAPLPEAAIPSEDVSGNGDLSKDQNDIDAMVYRWRVCGTNQHTAQK